MDAAMLCPRCGYDMRGTTGTRCSECGQEIDRAAMAESGLPWAQRKKLGRIRAFRATVRLICFDSRKIRHELSKPQDLRDARRFRVWVTALLSLSFLVAFTCLMVAAKLEEFLLHSSSLFNFGGNPIMPAWQQDLLVPWNAGIALFWPLPICIVLTAVYLTGVARACVRVKSADARLREAADALGRYAAAPLVWLIPSAALCPVMLGYDYMARKYNLSSDPLFGWVGVALLFAAGIPVVTVPLLAISRAGQWTARANHAGLARFAAGAAECIVRSLLGLIFCFVVIPWCLGLIWIAIDSLR